MGRKIDLTGQRFGRLTVIEYAGKSKMENLLGCANVLVAIRKLLRKAI